MALDRGVDCAGSSPDLFRGRKEGEVTRVGVTNRQRGDEWDQQVLRSRKREAAERGGAQDQIDSCRLPERTERLLATRPGSGEGEHAQQTHGNERERVGFGNLGHDGAFDIDSALDACTVLEGDLRNIAQDLS